MLKLRVQTGNTIKIGVDSALQLLSTDGQKAVIRIDSPHFCTVSFCSSSKRQQTVFALQIDERTVSLPEGSIVHLPMCTVLLKCVGPSAMICEFIAPRSVNIEKCK